MIQSRSVGPAPFSSLYSHGFVRVAAAVPRVRVAEPAFNAQRTLALARRASKSHAAVVIFPELGLSAYSNEDLFHQRTLTEAAAGGESVYDTTFENVQAGERTSHLFRLANHHRGLVVGTGDLSELALGWNTYGVGDQMSHYNVNASVPKTLIQFLLRWTIDTDQFGEHLGEVLASVLETTITPELIPAADPEAGRPEQDSERVIGPFALQDFFLYYTLRFGYRPSKVAFLAHHAWQDREHGSWPDLIPDQRRSEYSLAEIKHWLEVFLHRFWVM
jgi:NAD+ synthase (glutamine-hydrolysing)